MGACLSARPADARPAVHDFVAARAQAADGGAGGHAPKRRGGYARAGQSRKEPIVRPLAEARAARRLAAAAGVRVDQRLSGDTDAGRARGDGRAEGVVAHGSYGGPVDDGLCPATTPTRAPPNDSGTDLRGVRRNPPELSASVLRIIDVVLGPPVSTVTPAQAAWSTTALSSPAPADHAVTQVLPLAQARVNGDSPDSDGLATSEVANGVANGPASGGAQVPPLLALPPPSFLAASSAKVFAERRSLAVRLTRASSLKAFRNSKVANPRAASRYESEYARSDSTAGLAEAVELETRSMAEGKQLIDARLARLGLSSVLMMDDGNCQFRALSHQLFGDQSFHKEVRAEVVAWMKTHAASFAPFVGGRSDFYRYVADMGKNRCWGDELTLRAACDAFRCVLFIVQSTKTNWLLVYEPGRNARRSRAEDRDAHRKTVFLSYIAPVHYNSVLLPPGYGQKGGRASG